MRTRLLSSLVTLVRFPSLPRALTSAIRTVWLTARTDSAELGLPDTLLEYVQSDAFIHGGSSGGPLFDVNGRVIACVSVHAST